MRKRRHDILIRLDDSELEKLQADVANTHLSREAFLRRLIAGNTVMECPPLYVELTSVLWKIYGEIESYKWDKGLSREQREKLDTATDELVDVLHMLSDIYFPYFKWKRDSADQLIGFYKLKRETEEKYKELKGK